MIDSTGANRARLAPTSVPGQRLAASVLRAGLLGGIVLAASACSSDSDDPDPNAFVVRSTGHAAASSTTPLLGDGPWLAYRISEASQGAGGTDFNEDGDTLDSIAVRVNTATQSREILDVAADALHLVRRTMFMVVSESADGRDWNADTDMTDRVLLYLTPNATEPVFLDTVTPTGLAAISIGGTLTYASDTAPTLDMESNLRVVTVASSGAVPGAPTMVPATIDPSMDGITFELDGSDGDVIFLLSDEGLEGDLNGDGDATDGFIFGVLDAGSDTPEAICSCLPIASASTPTAVPISSGGEWLVAFLVDEAAQNENLNDPALFSGTWQPANCSGVPDTDMADAVLHWFQLTDLTMGTAAKNTGLVGAGTATAYAVRSGFVGVVSPEAFEGGCDLNDDGDSLDSVFRWVDASNPADPVLPVTNSGRLFAVDTAVAGGSGGVVRLSDTWVISVDEAADGRDHDGEPGVDRMVIAAHNPSNASQNWNFMHGASNPRPVGVTWMAEDPESSSRFFAAFSENFGTIGGGNGDLNGDGDAADSVPTIPRIQTGNQLTFPGVATATTRNNAGITVEENIGFHRVSEADQGNSDLNGDGDTNDFVVQRFSLVNSFQRALMGTSTNVNSDSVETGTGDAEFAAFLTEEFLEGTDFNGDGDTNDFVVRYMRLPQ
ncbi:hypothetical protein Poly30_20470 [Planctomycetes bacterium Poly30]|uniref:Uncharacterized protein n=1 Tax=Saltatorellus ferox TaxID=2528018 RepID=A0A518ER18_9BACT|nr:hypothetical protein Poly30_20470 [Planctomycetes bacterium Poly30]